MIVIKDSKIDMQKIRELVIKTESDPKFNTYYVEDVEVEIQTVPMFGVIIIYVENDNYVDFDDFMQQWKITETINRGNKNRNEEKAIYSSSLNMCPFGYIKGADTRMRVFVNMQKIEGNPSFLSGTVVNGVFNWYVKIVRKGVNGGGFICSANIDDYLIAAFKHGTGLLKEYLISAASTILCDTVGLFNREIKQLDFPRLDQYTYAKIGNIIDDVIHFNRESPASAEILLYLLQDKYNSYRNGFDIYGHYAMVENHAEFDHNERGIWGLANNEDPELYKNDVCFILGCPLFGHCAKVNLCYEINGEIKKSYVILSSMILTRGLSTNIAIRQNEKLFDGLGAVASIYRTKFNIKKSVEIKATYSILNFGDETNNIGTMIDAMCISQNKKNLLKGMYLNGYNCMLSPKRKKIIYAINKLTNQIFVGLPYIDDKVVMHFSNSSSVLFAYQDFY